LLHYGKKGSDKHKKQDFAFKEDEKAIGNKTLETFGAKKILNISHT